MNNFLLNIAVVCTEFDRHIPTVYAHHLAHVVTAVVDQSTSVLDTVHIANGDGAVRCELT